MREKYESLALAQLKELAKVRGIKGTSAMKKHEIVEAMLAEDERQSKEAAEVQSTKTSAPSVTRKVRSAAREVQAKAQPAAQEAHTTARVVQPTAQEAHTTIHVAQSAAQEAHTTARVTQSEQSIQTNTQASQPAEQTGQQSVQHRNRTVIRGTAQNTTQSVRSDSRYEEQTEQRPEEQRVDNRTDARNYKPNEVYDESQYPKELDSGMEASGILEVMPDGYGFIRCENYLPGENDVYVAPSQIRRFGLKTGDILCGNKRVKTQQEKFSALLFVRTINGYSVEESAKRRAFEDMTPIFPDERIKLETPGCSVAMRVMDLVSPVGKGQRGMIVSPPKAGKTTLLKEVAKSVLRANPNMHMLILLIDERPEEVTDIKEAIKGRNVEVIYSTFDELPEHHKRVSEMVIERAKRLVEHKKDVVILLDSITRLTRAYNQVVPPSGRTLSGGLDPSALHMPKRFFGAARNMREGGSLTILATALVDTGSKMDDVVYEEFKGTGNMEMVLDRKLSERRIFPAIDLQKSGTRREDLLLSADELEAINIMRKALNGLKSEEATDRILDMFARTRNNTEFVAMVKKNKFI
ncbi:MAG: transcription termination factor Rho [Lachnospiraceae bacterium]|nr:transcription termination factor Rho [Lachnospiraceae bacterium]